jgi:hypothetical protein
MTAPSNRPPSTAPDAPKAEGEVSPPALGSLVRTAFVPKSDLARLTKEERRELVRLAAEAEENSGSFEPSVEDVRGLLGETLRGLEAAERCDEASSAEARFYASCLAEEIAARVPGDEPEGASARRAAVGFALEAGQHARTAELARRYLDDVLVAADLRVELLAALAEARRALECVEQVRDVEPRARFRIAA